MSVFGKSEGSIERQLRGEIPSVPTPCVPEIDDLQSRVTARRRRRRFVAVASVASMAGAWMMATSVPHLDPRFTKDPQFTKSRLSDPPELGVFAGMQGNDSGTMDLVNPNDPAVEFRVFARVRDQLPVFGVDRETQQVQHVGWIESDCTIPVDLSGLSHGQQRSIKAVLDEETSPWDL